MPPGDYTHNYFYVLNCNKQIFDPIIVQMLNKMGYGEMSMESVLINVHQIFSLDNRLTA